MNSQMRFGGGTVEVNGQSFSASDIQEVRIIHHPAPGQLNRKTVLAGVNALAGIALGVLQGLRMFSGEAAFVVSLLLFLALTLNAWFIYTGVIGGGTNSGMAELAIQIRVGDSYTEILRSTDVRYVRETKARLQLYLDGHRS